MARPTCDTTNHVCNCGGLGQSAVELINGRWFVTMGHAGFNSRANNGFGYATEANARRAVATYQGRTARLMAKVVEPNPPRPRKYSAGEIVEWIPSTKWNKYGQRIS